jgi:hypothetical protein
MEGELYCCAKVDIGAFGAPGVVIDDAARFALMAGEPLLGSDVADRNVHLRSIHERCIRGDVSPLQQATGAFCIAQYDPTTRMLRLTVDKLGLRPLYYAVSSEFVVFSSALRVIEALPYPSRTLDLRGVAEATAFGYPLADRTPYAQVRCSRAAEIVSVTPRDVQKARYWHWDAVPTSVTPEAAAAEGVFAEFQRAVDRRLRGDRVTAAFLSGGLDSRAVVAAVREKGTETHTFNFARPGTQDQVFGRQIAAALGTSHYELPKNAGDRKPDYARLMASAWSLVQEHLPADRTPERPHLVWSGEGGSVCLGHVHMHQSVVATLRAGDIGAAIRQFLRLEDLNVPLRLFTSSVASSLAETIVDGIREELAGLAGVEPGRQFYLYLLLNDQRRKLASHFENIDLHRVELQLPFFDSDFLTSVIAVPVDYCLGHRFYHRWLENFRPTITSVPWQAYPGHVPCPIEGTEHLAYQWDIQYQRTEAAAQNRALLQQTFDLLAADDFPLGVLSRRKLAAAFVLHATGIRCYDYALKAAALCYVYSRKCAPATEAS